MRRKIFIISAVAGSGNNFTKSSEVPIPPGPNADLARDAEAIHALSPYSPEITWSAFEVWAIRLSMAAQAAMFGSNERMGQVGKRCIRKGQLATKGQLVKRASTVVITMGGNAACSRETMSILGLPALAARALAA